jgi:hypothetical protein
MKYDELILKIKNKEPFAFTRWGDGEWLNIRKSPGTNCDGNVYYPDLGDRLEQIVNQKQDYFLGAQDYKKFNLLSDVEKYDKQDWIDADMLHKASMDEQLQDLIEVLKTVEVVYIGNRDLKDLPFVDTFIAIPEKNVWLYRARVMELIKSTLTDKHKTYLFSAGMATNVFIHDLWNFNSNNTYIDVGSVFDPYVGKNTRSYHNKLNINSFNKTEQPGDVYYGAPFDANKNIGVYYNKFVKMLPNDNDWAVFFDSDAMFTTTDFGLLIEGAIKNYPDAAAFTCYTNRVACQWQIAPGVDKKTNDMQYHRNFGSELKKKKGYRCIEIPTNAPWMSGMFLAVKKSAWKKCGGFVEKGMLGVDNWFHQRLNETQQKFYLIEGLYVYHWYRNNGIEGTSHLT